MMLSVLLGSHLILFLSNFPDGVKRYAEGAVGSTQIGFGLPIVSDDVGDVNGVFLIPNGRAPVVGSVASKCC